MTDTSHVTSLEDHAKRASVDVPGAVRDALPFGSGETLGVREEGDGVLVVRDPEPSGPRAVLRGTGSGLRLYVDWTVACEAELLDATVALSASDEGLRLREATDRRRSEGFTWKLGHRRPCAAASCSSLSR